MKTLKDFGTALRKPLKGWHLWAGLAALTAASALILVDAALDPEVQTRSAPFQTSQNKH